MTLNPFATAKFSAAHDSVSTYVLALVAVAVAAICRWLLQPLLGEANYFFTFLVAVVFSAWIGGWRPAALAAICGAFMAWYFFLPPKMSFLGISQSHVVGTLIYLLVCGFFTAFGQAMRNAKEEAAQQAELLQVTLASIGDAVIATDANGKVTYLNRVAEKLTGWSQSLAQGQSLESVFQIVNESTRIRVENPAQRALATGAYIGLANHTILIAKDGSERPIDDGAAPIRNQAGDILGCVLVFRDVTERKRDEQQIREAQSRLSSTLAAGEVGTWEFDLVNNVVRADTNLARMFGVRAADADTGTLESYLNAIHPDDRERVSQSINLAVTNCEEFHAEYRLLSADQIVKWVVARGRVEANQDGRVVRLPGVVVDITAQREAENRERQILTEAVTANAKFRAFFDQGTLFAAIVSLDGTIVDPNRVCWEACGYTRDQVLGKLFWEGPWWDPSPPLARLVKAAFAEATAGRIFRGELPYFAADGSERVFDLTILPIKDDHGQIIYIVPSGLDITQRKLIESQLQESEERRRLALDSAELGAWHIDPRTNTLSSDARFQVIFSGNVSPINYEQAFALIHPHDRDRVRLAVEAAVRPDDPAPYAEEYRVIHPQDRQVRWVHGKGRVNFQELDGERHFVSFDGTVADITERKHMEHELRELAANLSDVDRRKDEFLATLAHELRNPLAPIRTGLQVMKLSKDDPDAVEEARSMMERQLTQLVRLVDDLIDISRISTGKLELRKAPVELAGVVKSAVETSRPLISQMSHHLTIQLPEEPIFIDGDLTRLSQVFMNLLNNAAKYNDRGGHIELTAQVHGNQVDVTVHDDGIGIPQDKLTSIFEMFSQVDRSLEKSQGGLGIGLALVKRLVEMHDGTIEARSDGVGKGAEFIVTLPIGPQSAEVKAEEKVQSVVLPSKFRILVVDDNRDGANSLAMMLQILGNETRTAYDGQEAVDIAESYQPDLILLDIGLPKLNGYEACRRIRDRSWSKNVIVVALTGWGQDEDRRRSQEAGFDQHFVKPVDPIALMKLLNEPKKQRSPI